MSSERDREIKEIRRRIKENQAAINKLYLRMKKALSEAKECNKQIGKMRAENVVLMNRLKALGNQLLQERIEVT